jgi:hypothetical protein
MGPSWSRQFARSAAGSRHARWLIVAGWTQREGAILSVTAEISQISDSSEPVGVANIFLFLME